MLSASISAAAETPASPAGDSSVHAQGRIIAPASSAGFGKGLSRTWRSALQTALAVDSFDSSDSIDSFRGLGYEAWLNARADRAIEGLVGGTLGYVADYLVSAGADGQGGFGFIRTVDWDFKSQLGSRRWQAGVSALGAFSESESGATVWQLRGYGAEDEAFGTNAGIALRRVYGNALLGANAFIDYESNSEYDKSFLRYSVGLEARTELFDLYGNSYIALTGSDRDEPAIAYSRDGFDLGIQGHLPGSMLLSGGLTYYFWDGEYGDADDRGLRYNIALSPALAASHQLRLELEFEDPEDGSGEFGGQISYQYSPGAPEGRPAAAFDPQAHLFAPVRREHAQRIGLAGDGRLLASVAVSRGSATVYFGSTAEDFDAAKHNPLNYARNVGFGTAPASEAEIRADSGAWTIELRESTRIDFESRGTILSLAMGTIFVDRNGGVDEIRMSGIRITLRGTALSVGFDGEHGLIWAKEGAIDIVTEDGPNSVRLMEVAVEAEVIRDDAPVEQPDPTGGVREVSFAAFGAHAEEGETANITIAISPAAAAAAQITIVAAGGSAEAADWQFSGGCTTTGTQTCVVDIAANATNAVVAVSAVLDTVPDEPPESVTLRLAGLAPAGFHFLDARSEMVFAVEYNDPPEWSDGSLQRAVFGQAYDLDLNDIILDPEGAGHTCSADPDDLPDGIALGGTNNCELLATDVSERPGVFTVTIAATDASGSAATEVFDLTVFGRIRIRSGGRVSLNLSEGSMIDVAVQVMPPFESRAEVTLFSADHTGDWVFAGLCKFLDNENCAVEVQSNAAEETVQIIATSDGSRESDKKITVSLRTPLPPYYMSDGSLVVVIKDDRAPSWRSIPPQNVLVGGAVNLNLNRFVTEPNGQSYSCAIVGSISSSRKLSLGGTNNCVLSSAGVGGSESTFDITVQARDAGGKIATQIVQFSVGEAKLQVTGDVCDLTEADYDKDLHVFFDTKNCKSDVQTIRFTGAPSDFAGSSEFYNVHFTNLPADGEWQVQIDWTGLDVSDLAEYYYDNEAEPLDYRSSDDADPTNRGTDHNEAVEGSHSVFFTIVAGSRRDDLKGRDLGDFVAFAWEYSGDRGSGAADQDITFTLIQVP